MCGVFNSGMAGDERVAQSSGTVSRNAVAVTRGKARLRKQPARDGSLNATETKYAAYLEQQKRGGQIVWYAFEPHKLRLADRTFYTPDFAVLTSSGELEYHEVKGFWEDDARVKIKVAAETHWMFRFIAVQPVAKKRGGGWSTEEF